MVSPALYIANLVLKLRSIWVSSEGSRYLFQTKDFEFATESFEGWTGRVCRPEAPALWFGDMVSRWYDLGLQLTQL